MTTTGHFSVKGMTCGNCVRHVEKALQDVSGVLIRRRGLGSPTGHCSL